MPPHPRVIDPAQDRRPAMLSAGGLRKGRTTWGQRTQIDMTSVMKHDNPRDTLLQRQAERRNGAVLKALAGSLLIPNNLPIVHIHYKSLITPHKPELEHVPQSHSPVAVSVPSKPTLARSSRVESSRAEPRKTWPSLPLSTPAHRSLSLGHTAIPRRPNRPVRQSR
jgi:hypothetical protein